MPTIDLDTLTLARGAHLSRDEGMCILEAVAYAAGEPHTDAPTCASKVLRTYAMSLNDQWDDARRQDLKPYILRMIGTADDGQDETRSLLALDWLVRTYTPAWLDLAGLTTEATALRELEPITDLATAKAATPAAGDAAGAAARAAARAAATPAAGDAAWAAARAAAWAAAGAALGDAAWDAARAAARAALGGAAWAAAGDAAGDAAWAAARAAARAAAGDAAWAAAGAALAPTVEVLRVSALDLFDRMIDPAGAHR